MAGWTAIAVKCGWWCKWRRWGWVHGRVGGWCKPRGQLCAPRCACLPASLHIGVAVHPAWPPAPTPHHPRNATPPPPAGGRACLPGAPPTAPAAPTAPCPTWAAARLWCTASSARPASAGPPARPCCGSGWRTWACLGRRWGAERAVMGVARPKGRVCACACVRTGALVWVSVHVLRSGEDVGLKGPGPGRARGSGAAMHVRYIAVHAVQRCACGTALCTARRLASAGSRQHSTCWQPSSYEPSALTWAHCTIPSFPMLKYTNTCA